MEPCKQESTLSNLASKIAVIETKIESILERQREILSKLKGMEDNCFAKEISRNKSISDLSTNVASSTALLRQQYDDVKALVDGIEELNEELSAQDRLLSSVEKDLKLLSDKFSDRITMCDRKIFGELIDKVVKLERLEKITAIVCGVVGVIIASVAFIKSLPILADILIKIAGLK